MVDKFILDADVFIQAKNLHYRFDFCTGFWDWITQAHNGDIVFSIQKVRSQLISSNKTDKAKLWAESTKTGFFLDDQNDPQVMEEYAKLITAVTAKTQYNLSAINWFLDSKNADAFLIAAAKRHGFMLITHEVSAPDSKSDIKIPDAAKLVGVKTMHIFDCLSQHSEDNFKFKP